MNRVWKWASNPLALVCVLRSEVVSGEPRGRVYSKQRLTIVSTLNIEYQEPRKVSWSSFVMAMTAKTQTGLDFQDLAKGGERNYSCSFLVNLDPDLMSLTNPGGNFLDKARDALAAHTTRIIEQIRQR